MRYLSQFVRRSKRIISDDVDTELQFHLDARAEELVRSGMDADAAHGQALREFGDVRGARDYINRMDRRTEAANRRRDYFGELGQDLRHALRQLRTAPSFAATAIATLALGVGANTAIFSIVNGVLLQPLPFPQPQQLVKVWSANRTAGNLHAPMSILDFDDFRAQRKNISDMGAYFFVPGGTGLDLTGGGRDPQRISVAFVTAGFFGTLGAAPERGRLPRDDEMVRGGSDHIVVLSHTFWLRQFSGSPTISDTTLTLGGEPYRVAGVLPANFRFPSDQVEIYVPYSSVPDHAIPHIRPVRILDVVARLGPGVTLDRARAELDATAQGLSRQYPDDAAWDGTTLAPLHDAITGGVRKSLLVLLGAVGFVLLIACVNVASLQLARATVRAREMAVRMALGAGRGRIVRQLVTENVVLALVGGGVGLVVAKVALNAVLAMSAGQLPRGSEIHLDALVVMGAMIVAVVCGVLFGLAPALVTTRHIEAGLRAGGRGTTPGGNRLRHALVVAEVALAMMLVIGGGLMTRSFITLLHEDPGFRPDHLLAMNFSLSTERLPNYGAAYERIVTATRDLPGVVSAGAVRNAPFRGVGERTSFTTPGMVVPAGQDRPLAALLHVSDGYFHTIGARVVEGREFTPGDRTGAPQVVLVNEAFARQWFPGKRATEQRILLDTAQIPIVGVVNDIRQVGMGQPAVPTIYVDNQQQNSRVQTTLVVRTAGDPMSMVSTVRKTIWSVDRLQPITAIFTFDDAVSDALARPRLLTVVLGVFGALGLLLGAIGLYGVLAFLVSQRQREIGVRLAIGARPRDVRSMVVRRGLALTAAGLVIGAGGALALGRYLREVLYGITPADFTTYAIVAAVLLGVAMLASWIPAQRAAAVDPAITLRSD